MTNDDCNDYPVLRKLVERHEKNLERFQEQATKFFHPYAVKLCKRIRKGIPEFEGCTLAMRHLYLEPADLMLPMSLEDDGVPEVGKERLGNIMNYLPDADDSWNVGIPDDTKNALMELDKLADYIDDNYSMVGDLHVDLTKEK